MLVAQIPDYSWAQLVTILACPECGRHLTFKAISQDLPFSGEYGVLSCGCGRYPVVDGIPVLMKGTVGSFEHTQGHVEFTGPTVEELVDLVVGGRGLEALLRCISFPLTVRQLVRVLPRNLWCSSPVQGIMIGLRRIQLRRWCTTKRLDLTAEDWFRVFCGEYSPVQGDMFNYFFYRFGQQHHLASLVLTSQLPASERPVLDLACGFGHLAHNLAGSPAAHAVVGLDRNFFQLWTAKYWVAPASRFVCANADHRLPFAEGSFAAVLCADAFHYFRNKTVVLDEMTRCAPGRPVMLTGVGNKLVQPPEGCELSPREYLALRDAPGWQIFGEGELLKSYLRGESLDLSTPRSADALNDEKWLSLVYSGRPPFLMQPDRCAAWPHAAGRLSINPIYRVSKAQDGGWRLRFVFPSRHFASENAKMLSFCPKEIVLTDETFGEVQANVRSPAVENLIERMIVVGMPDHYTRL